MVEHTAENRGVAGSIPALATLFCLALAAAGCGSHSTSHAKPLLVVPTRTPRLVVGWYDVAGTYPQVRGGRSFARVNAALRRALADDQRRYETGMGKVLNPWCNGIYATQIDPRLTSASTVVVSAMLPALELYPCGNDGSGWVSATISVASGRSVGLADLFASRRHPLRVLAREWRRRFGTTALGRGLLHAYPTDFRRQAFRTAFFALTPRGLAVGFWQDGPTQRLQAVVPYVRVRPYLSALGTTLVAGVRTPRWHGRRPRAGLDAPPFDQPPIDVPANVHRLFRTSTRPIVHCELTEQPNHVRTRVDCWTKRRGVRTGAEIAYSGGVRFCRGARCAWTRSRREDVLRYGESVGSWSFTCIAGRTDVHCARYVTLDAAAFIVGRRGARR